MTPYTMVWAELAFASSLLRPSLKHEVFPLAGLLRDLLELGMRGTGSPIEIEFAVRLPASPLEKPVFGLVQLRPLSGAGYVDDLDIDSIAGMS